MITKTQINNLGKELRQCILSKGEIPTGSLDVLQAYRTAYKPDVAAVFSVVSSLSKRIRADRIISMRIKRIESILSKIRRQPTMALGNMGDIAGCRCIVKTEIAVRKLVIALSQRLIVKKYNDYLTESKPDGYRGYHLYVQSPINPEKLIEIQIRTLESHNWATLVEILDITFNLKMKEGEVDLELSQLLTLLSRKRNLSISEMKTIIDIDRKRDIYSKLKDIFNANHVSMRRKWIEASRNHNDRYFIIEVDERKESRLESFVSYNEAEQVYYKKFISNTGSNFVLTHIEKPDFKKICIAYSNYILIHHEYLNDWNIFVQRVMEQNLSEGNKKEFTYYYDYVERNLSGRIAQVKAELQQLGDMISVVNADLDKYRVEPLGEWSVELGRQVDRIETFQKGIAQMKKKFPESFWQKLFR